MSVNPVTIEGYDGCNGDDDRVLERNELFYLVIPVTNDINGPLYRDAIGKLECEDLNPFDEDYCLYFNIGNTTIPEPNGQSAMYGDLNPGTTLRADYSVIVSAVLPNPICNSGTMAYRFKLTVTSPDLGTPWQTTLPPLACGPSNLAAVPTPMPAEQCDIYVTKVGAGARFNFTAAALNNIVFPDWNMADRYNMYRGDVYNPFRYNHLISQPFGIGFCNIPEPLLQVVGSIPCNCPYDGVWGGGDPQRGRCPTGPSAPNYYLTYLDGEEDSANQNILDVYYYLISAEERCPFSVNPDVIGAEGSLGTNSFGVERPYGGGDCALPAIP